MKTCLQTWKITMGCLLALGAATAVASLNAAVAQDGTNPSKPRGVTTASAGGGAAGGAAATGKADTAGTIHLVEPTSWDSLVARQDRAWLGVSIEEGSEALAAQLGLAPGSGLVVTYIAPDSPAAKAGLEKNDVLVELDGQLLVVPAQLRKLVEVRKEGDAVELVFYRAGKKQSASATLGKAPAGGGLFGAGGAWDGASGSLLPQLQTDALQLRLKQLRDAVGNQKFNTSQIAEVTEQLYRNLDAERRQALRELHKSGINVDNNASVTVSSTGERNRSIVKADESGTIVLVCNPRPRLTAHDKDGKLLFDGEISTPEQRAKVPADLMEKVEPLLKKLEPKDAEEGRLGPGGSGAGSRHFRAPPVRGGNAATL